MIGLKVNASFWIFQISPKARSDVGEENSKFTYFWFTVLCGKLCNTFSELEMNLFRLKPWHFKTDTSLHVTLIKTFSFDIDLRFRTNFTSLVESSPDWQYGGNQPFEKNVRSFGNLITDFHDYLSKGILTNQRLLGQQKRDGAFFQCHQLYHFSISEFCNDWRQII